MNPAAAAAAVLSALVASAPCDDLPSERAALAQAARGEAQFADVAAALEQRCGAPLAAGIALEGGPAEGTATALTERLESFCARARAQGPAALRSGDRAHLSEVLSRPEFAQARAPDVNGLARMAAWLTAWLDSLFQTGGAQSFARGTRVLVLALAIAVVLGVALRLAGTWPRRGARTETIAPRPGGLDAPASHLARAGSLLEADPRGAIREGLFALLASLERRALARPDRVKTNREVAEEIAQRGAAPGLSEEVRGLVGWYDRTYYSLDLPPAPEAKRFVEAVTQLAARLAERPA